MNHVLVLDDDEQFGEMVARRLQREEGGTMFSAERASSAQQAIDLVCNQQKQYDIYLIDHRLGPGDDGITVMQELRRLNPNAEAILFTGYDDPDIGMNAYEAGAYRYLHKPFDPTELIWILRSLVHQKATRFERDWLETLADVAQQAQSVLSIDEVIEMIVQGGIRLGFERTRLYRIEHDVDDRPILVGTKQAGTTLIPNFEQIRLPIAETTYAQY